MDLFKYESPPTPPLLSYGPHAIEFQNLPIYDTFSPPSPKDQVPSSPPYYPSSPIEETVEEGEVKFDTSIQQQPDKSPAKSPAKSPDKSPVQSPSHSPSYAPSSPLYEP